MHSLGVRELKQRVRRATSAHPNKRSGDGHHAVSQSRRSKMGSAKKKLRKSETAPVVFDDDEIDEVLFPPSPGSNRKTQWTKQLFNAEGRSF